MNHERVNTDNIKRFLVILIFLIAGQPNLTILKFHYSFKEIMKPLFSCSLHTHFFSLHVFISENFSSFCFSLSCNETSSYMYCLKMLIFLFCHIVFLFDLKSCCMHFLKKHCMYRKISYKRPCSNKSPTPYLDFKNDHFLDMSQQNTSL